MAASADIQRSLGRLEGKVDQILEGLENHEHRDHERFGSIEKRLGNIEKKIWYGSGIAAVGAFILAKLTFGLYIPGKG
jgi:hypothetical protein